MSDAHDENKKDLAFDLIQYPIAHARAVKLLFALDLLNSLRCGFSASVSMRRYPSPYRTVEGFEVSFRSGCELNSVGQLEAQLSLDLLPRHGAFFLRFCQRRPRFFEIDLIFERF